MVGTIIDDREVRLTPTQEALNLAKHGTRPCALTPRAIVQAAEQDMRAKRHNLRIKDAKAENRQKQKLGLTGRKEWADEQAMKFAFWPAHVKSADCAAALIAAAIEGRDKVMEIEAVRDGAGENTGLVAKLKRVDVNTYRIYSDESALRAALEIARAQ